MKTIFFTACAITCALLLNYKMNAQSTSGNNNIGFGKFLGYNGPQNLEFRTNNTTRMQMMQNGFSNINGFNIDRSGFLGLSQDPNFFTGGAASPFSLLHLNGDNNAGAAQQLGYRNWMRYGITFTHNQDLMYIGPRRNDADDVTDAVIAWADNTQFSQNGPDNLVFMFTTGGATGNDLETGRMTAAGFTGIGTSWSNGVQPKRPLDVIRIDGRPQFRLSYASGSFYNETPGTYADFQTSPEGNLHIKPVDDTELRATTIGFLDNEEPDPLVGTVLDVGPGRTRIRQLPEISPDALIIGYRFEDVNMVDEDNFIGRLEFPDDEEADCFVLNGEGEWIDVCNLAGGDLDWETNGTDVWTGHGQGGFPGDNVGIGLTGQNTEAKLHVQTTGSTQSVQTVAIKAETFPSDPPTTISTGMEIRANGGSSITRGTITYITNNNSVTNYGDELKISTSANSNFGFRSEVGNASNQNYGVHSSTISGGANYNYAVYGNACNADRNFGIYGKTCGTDNGNLAGFFEGDFSFTGAFIPPSDQNLKTDIQTIQSPSETLSQLAPKVYHFNQNVGDLNLPTGPQMGLIAQDVEDVLPFLVQSITKPAVMDSSGNILTEAYTYKGLKYLDFIALLIAGFNEQSELTETQAQIVEDHEDTIEELEGEVAALTSSLSELQNSVAQLETMVQQSLQKSEDCCAKVLGENSPGVINGKQNTLEQNVPNPFEQETRIDFNLAASGKVKLMITNATGQTVETLANGDFSSGRHEVTWNASGQAPGVYYYTLYVDGELMTKRMIKL